VVRMLTHERLRRETAARGFERLVERFSAERMGAETAAAYERALRS
jgi:hypothetical protein